MLLSVDLHDQRERADLWVAALAGPLPWLGDSSAAIDRAVGAIGFALAMTALSWTGLDAWQLRDDPRSSVAALTFLVAWLVFNVPTLWWVCGRSRLRLASLWVWGATRSVVLVVALCAWVALAPPLPVVRVMPIGASLGAELAVTAGLLGEQWIPKRWVTDYLLSTGHLVLLIASAVAVILLPGRESSAVFQVFAAIDVGVLAAIAAAAACTRLLRASIVDRQQLSSEVRRAEFEDRMHWMHDDVLALLTSLRLKATDGGLQGDRLVAAFLETDHLLREVQLEQGLSTGSRRIHQVLQPYVRRVESLGVRVVEVPRLEETGVTVSERTGRLLQRAIAVTTANAVEARATELRVRVTSDQSFVRLVVEDNAGGGVRVVPGRGLAELTEQLGTTVNITDTSSGSIVEVLVPSSFGTSPIGSLDPNPSSIR